MSTVDLVRLKSGVLAVRHLASGEIMHVGSGPGVEPTEIYVAPSRLGERLLDGGPDPVVLLDIGLGAASNALAAWHVSEASPESARRLEVVSFEHDLAPLELALKEGAELGVDGTARTAVADLLAHRKHETARTSWRLLYGDIRDCLLELPDACADIVFWDPYSRGTDAALWSLSTFRGARRVCRAGATMHTFSTATPVRSAMLLAGFAVGVGASTGNKAQTTIAATSHDLLDSPLDARWLERLSRSSGPFPSDIEDRDSAFAAVRACPQFSEKI